MEKHVRMLDRNRSALLVIDLQESYRGKLHNEAALVRASQILLDAAGKLAIPVLLTEQYPKGLGTTREEIATHLPETATRFEKTSFSALGAPGLREHLRELDRDQIVVAGIETHVCVNQSTHDILAQGWQAHLVRDAISARHPLEDETGFAKMTQSGAIPTSVEAVLFEWLEDSRSPDFKSVQPLVV